MTNESLHQVPNSLKSSASDKSSAALSSTCSPLSLPTLSSVRRVGQLNRPPAFTNPSRQTSPSSGNSCSGGSGSGAPGKLSDRNAYYMTASEKAPISAPLRTSSSNLPSLFDSSTVLPSKTAGPIRVTDTTASSSTSSLTRLLADREVKRSKTGKKKLFSTASDHDDSSQVIKGICKSKIRENHFYYILGKVLTTARNVLSSALVTLGIQSVGNKSSNFTAKGSNGKMSSTLAALLCNQYSKVTTGFQSLQSSPSELWKAYLLKFLDSYAYFSFSLIFTIFLSHEFGMSDVRAGTIYGAWGALITVFGLVTGTIIDNLGVAKCLRIGFSLSFITRLTLFFCTSETVLLFCTLVALPLANCLGIPVLTVGIRRYTNDENRGFAFGLFYVIMNVGALVAGPLVDVLTIYYKGGGSSEGDDDFGNDNNDDAAVASSTSKWAMTTNRAIILSGVVANFFAVFVAFSVREIKVDANAKKSTPLKNTNANKQAALVPTEEPGDDMNVAGNVDDSASERGIGINDNSSSSSTKVTQFQPIKGSSLKILSETVRTPNFRRFLLVCLLTLNVRMVFRHLDGTLPKYMMREFGPDTPKGMVYSINPALIIVLVPIITAATSTVPPLVMIHRGTYVSALSVFFLALSTSLPACILFVITLSIGEALWSPRLYDFTMSVAQEGREGTYMALSSAPLFLAKLPVGFLSGLLLQRYCPETLEEGEVRHSKTMWWIIGLSTIVSPIMITVLWGYISGGERSRSDSDIGTPGARGIAMRIKDGERGVQDDDDVYGYSDERDLFQNDEDLESKTESPYQHRPLTTNLSLPRVRASEKALT